ncbi:hypothetical protein FUAX_13420 [Fulvitalea axinellae]|uniref:NADAR domain-containing protein n=1 Tax=Fulvitalea axinellae TaxID=1182444 RepID=A0AAU9D9F1_9BACT|nr:hypothetical protein FUAX_13420 [Fulvitalea axinellae]
MNEMKYSWKKTVELFRSGKCPHFLFFWGHRANQKGNVTKSCLSQWWPSSFTVDGVTYKSTEHWMMAEKARLFNDDKMLAKIIEAETPAEAKKLGRKISPFVFEQWVEHRFEIVVKGNYHKFSQNEKLKAFLCGTGDTVLVEASPVDNVWGIGLTADSSSANDPATWRGENLLGFALMEARDRILEVDGAV